MIDPQKLKKLVVAHKDGKDELFNKVLDSIIQDEEASNRFESAKDLKSVLSYKSSSKELSAFKSQVDSLKNLVLFKDPFVDETNIFLPAEIKRFVDRLYQEHSNKKKLLSANLQPKSKILFYGPPGTGKTYTAHYIATVLGLPLGIVQLSNVISSFMGDTAANLAKIFAFASRNPCVLLIDEFDTFAKERNQPNDVGELQRIVNTLLQTLDSISTSDSLIIATTNHEGLLDYAVWRRFEGVLEFKNPSKEEISSYLEYLLSGVKFKGVKSSLLTVLSGMSYSEVSLVVKESLKTMLITNQSELTLDLIKSETENLYSYKMPEKKSRSRSKK